MGGACESLSFHASHAVQLPPPIGLERGILSDSAYLGDVGGIRHAAATSADRMATRAEPRIWLRSAGSIDQAVHPYPQTASLGPRRLRLARVFFVLLATPAKAARISRERQASSRKPQAMRSMTLILLLKPSTRWVSSGRRPRARRTSRSWRAPARRAQINPRSPRAFDPAAFQPGASPTRD